MTVKDMRKETNGKFIIQLTGPVLKYRLQILKTVCPEIRHFLLCLTNKDSYDLYEEYHDFFQFIIMDDYRSEHPISLKTELFPNFRTEKEYFEKIRHFYGNETRVYYSYDIHRFIYPYLIEHKILNFSFTDTDFIMINDFDRLNDFFDNVAVGTCYGPWHGEDMSAVGIKRDMWKNDIQPLYPEIKLEAPFLRTIDGFMRGFHFKNIDDMKLLFNLWNTTIDVLLTNDYYKHSIIGNNGMILHTEWVISHIMQFFEYQLGYKFCDMYDVLNVRGKEIGKHITRPEDTIYMTRYGWEIYNFDYSDITSVSAFVNNNKKQLTEYYSGRFPIIEIINNFVYTKLN